MCRVIALSFLPAMVLVLEPVNIIKNRGFEKYPMPLYSWKTDAYGDTEGSTHDSSVAFAGKYCAFGDTRSESGTQSLVSFTISQSLDQISAEDLDSVIVAYSLRPIDEDLLMSKLYVACVGVKLLKEDAPVWWSDVQYRLKAPGLVLPSSWKILGEGNFAQDTVWHEFRMDLGKDIYETLEIPLGSYATSFFLKVEGDYLDEWRGQRVYWDEVRLMTYVDNDVGIKEVLSGSVLIRDVAYYPKVRIKNFGRNNAWEFKAFAEIFEVDGGFYYTDTMTCSLSADTEDTLVFSPYFPSQFTPVLCSLRFRTEMADDASEANNQLVKVLHSTGIAEPVTPVTHPVTPVTHFNSVGREIILHYSDCPQGFHAAIYDASGRRVDEIYSTQTQGIIQWGAGRGPGVYFIVPLGSKVNSVKVILVH